MWLNYKEKDKTCLLTHCSDVYKVMSDQGYISYIPNTHILKPEYNMILATSPRGRKHSVNL